MLSSRGVVKLSMAQFADMSAPSAPTVSADIPDVATQVDLVDLERASSFDRWLSLHEQPISVDKFKHRRGIGEHLGLPVAY